MNRCRNASLLAAGLMLMLAGCGDGPGNPGPPQSPPRPTTWNTHLDTAHLALPASPVVPRPGVM